MPPDMNKLPKPGDDLEVNNQTSEEEFKQLLQIKENKKNQTTEENSDLLNNMKKKIQ